MRTQATAAAIAVGLALTAAPAAAQQPCAPSYTVRSGDNLTEIAQRCGVSVPSLVAANPALRGGARLEPGGTLRIPPTDRPEPTPVQACGAFYTLQPGDDLPAVAARCGLTVPLILAANPGLSDPDNARPGARLRVPDLPPPGAFEPVIVGGSSTAMIGPAGAAAEAAARAAADSAAARDEADAADDADPADDDPFARYEGVLRTGARCTILRTSDGTDVAIVGGLGPGFEVGDRVGVTGPAVEDAGCGTDRAVSVRIMWRPRP